MDERRVDRLHFGDAAYRALEDEPGRLAERSDPAALGLFRQNIEPASDIVGSLLAALIVGEQIWIERAGNRRLLHHAAVVARVQAVEDVPDLPRLLDQRTQIRAGALLAGG